MQTLKVTICFYKYARRTLPLPGYRPHIVAAADPTYLGVVFVNFTDDITFDMECDAEIALIYTGVDYSALKPGVKFEVREGAKCVGYGFVSQS